MLEGGDEAGDVDSHGTSGHAARLLAAQAALSLVQSAIEIESQRHFVEIVNALLGRLMRQVLKSAGALFNRSVGARAADDAAGGMPRG